jgi:hypothetical protein
MPWETLLYVAVGILFLTLAIDIWQPKFLKEGFLIEVGDNPFLTGYFPRRGDVSFGSEEAGIVQDKRHVMGYADVQGLGVNHDFCRMVVPLMNAKEGEFAKADDSGKFFACALAGTENLASTKYRTLSVKDGFKTSRDDYMRDADKDGRSDYCAVIKAPSGSWEPRCYRGLTTTFDTRSFFDSDPPEDISDIVEFYQGIMFWFRFIDDMKDYAENLNVFTSGGIKMDEADVQNLPSQTLLAENRISTLDERTQKTQGLRFNGSDQFMRLGDSADMSFGKKISLTTMRALTMWVYCDEFGNNVHFLDFGNGAGIDNVFVGILGRGDGTIEKGSEIRADACKTIDLNKVMPDFPSGAQFSPVMSPMELMLQTANVDEPQHQQGVLPRNLKPVPPPQAEKETAGGETATLLYEVWNGKLRMQHIKVQGAIKLKKWTHICITTATGDGVRPALEIWIDGVKSAEDSNAHLPQTSFTSNNYLGKSNWFNASSQFENKPEMFKGGLFDVRGYNQSVTEEKLKKTIRWGKLRLGI